MTRELTDDQINAIWGELNTPLNQSRLTVFGMARIRAIIKADRALRVPMTEDEIDAKWELSSARCWIEFEEGIRAAEAFHGIKT